MTAARVCNFSWRVSASWRANGRRHSLQTKGFDPVSLTHQVSDQLQCSSAHPSLRARCTRVPYGSVHVSECRGQYNCIHSRGNNTPRTLLTLKCSALENPLSHTRQIRGLAPGDAVDCGITQRSMGKGRRQVNHAYPSTPAESR